MKMVFMGSPEFAVPPLRALKEAGYEVVAVVTQPDKPVGRKGVLTPTPVKSYAESAGIPVYCFPKIREHAEEIKKLGADVAVTCAYGQLLTQEILDIFPMGVYNLHASLLPLFRGASPIQSAIWAGCERTGVTVMKTELAMDSGDILLTKSLETGGKTCGELSAELSQLSAAAAVEAIELLRGGNFKLTPQNGAEATFCRKIFKEDARVDFSADSKTVANLINAFSPSPAAFAFLGGAAVNLLKASVCNGAGESGSVLSADKRGIVIACGNGAVNITRLQFAGGKVIAAADAVNGRKVKAGDKFD